MAHLRASCKEVWEEVVCSFLPSYLDHYFYNYIIYFYKDEDIIFLIYLFPLTRLGCYG